MAKSTKHSSKKSFFYKIWIFLRKAWDYVWNGTSATSWVLAILFAFVLVRFVFYPVVGVALGTQLPMVAVISGSMEHDGDFGTWWGSPAVCSNITSCTQKDWYAQHSISQELFLSFSLKNGFNKGDLILLRGKKPPRVEVGDVLVFEAKTPYPVIHRVINITKVINEDTNNLEFIFQTKGDHNWYPIQNDYVDEIVVPSSNILGVAYARVPWFGWLKIWVSQGISSAGSLFEQN